MKALIIIMVALVALAGCSKLEEGNAGSKIAAAEDQAESVSHAKAEQPDPTGPSAKPARQKKPSALDRLLREGAQEQGQGLGRFDRKRGE